MYNTILWKQRRRKELRDKRNNIVSFIVIVLMFLAGIYGLLYGIITSVDASEITPEQMINSGELYKVYCTAYNDSETSTGKRPIEGLTVAGAKEWVGCTCVLYDENLEFLGFYEFQDIGYGTETNHGKSNLRDGKHFKTIEAGECIDLWFNSESEVDDWGKELSTYKLSD